jgi:2-methylcitrate dehydratase PrpD
MSVEVNLTEELARFATDFPFQDFSASAREYARNWLIDSVACALAGDQGDETASYAAFARAAGGEGESTIIGSSEKLSLLGASMLNGYLITAVTVCDTYVPAHLHVAPEVVPPALAVAEQGRMSGRALLAAVAIGAEVTVRVARGINYAVAGPLGWHMPGIVGPFGAAAAVGRLRGLTALQMRNALGLAGSQAAGTWASWGTPAVKFHQSRGAASGLMAALLAEQDFKASADILGHLDGGILAAYSKDGGKPEEILAGLGKSFELEEISLRLWPGGTPLQPTLTAVFDLLGKEKVDWREVENVRIEVAPDVYEAHARFTDPKGVFEALLSYHFAIASALRDRRFWLDSIGPTMLRDPDLRRFMAERVEFAADTALTRRRSRVVLRTTDGRTLTSSADAAKGTPDNPVTLNELQDKFERCTAGRLDDTISAELFQLLVHIEETESLDRLFELLAAARLSKDRKGH